MDKTGSDRSMPRSITRLTSSTASSNNHHHVRIPIRIEDCAHFHYDKVELASISVSLYTMSSSSGSSTAAATALPTTPTSLLAADPHHHNHSFLPRGQRTPYCGISPETAEFFFTALVQSRGQSWLIRRTYTQLKNFDKMLHQCAWDRHVSRLEPPPSMMELSQIKRDVEEYKSFVHAYLGRLTALTGAGSGGFSPSPTGGGYYNTHHSQHSATGNVACSLITCGPVLNFLEMDNRGNRLIPFCHDSEINTPAIAAVHVTRAREPAAKDELQLEVGDIISVIDMPPAKESNWWRGKRGLEVGYFPADCVQVISVSHTPRGNTNNLASGGAKNQLAGATASGSVTSSRGVGVMSLEEAQKRQPAVLKSRNKLSAVLRNFFAHGRPPRGLLRQAGLLQERVFGCDLAEHMDRLARTDLLIAANHHHVPVVVIACCEFVEFYCLHSDGVYRRSGVQSNIQKLRQEFDNMDNYYATNTLSSSGTKSLTDTAASKRAVDSSSDVISIPSAPFLDRDQYRTDIHCVPSVLKQYFRELPNPLLTHQLFHSFLRVTRLEAEAERIELLRQTVMLLPPPHYQTLKYLMRHLHLLATEHATQTSMNEKNLARVWGPNLLRKPEQGSLDAGTKNNGLPTETSDNISAAAAAAVQIMGSKGGSSSLRSTAGGGISHPTQAVKIAPGHASAAETANLEMMTEVVQGAVIVELMIRQYDVVFEQEYRDDEKDESAGADDAGDFSALGNAVAAGMNNNDLMTSQYDSYGNKTPFRISFRRQQQKYSSSAGDTTRPGDVTGAAVTSGSAGGGESSVKVSRRIVSNVGGSSSSTVSTTTKSSKTESDAARRNKTISMLQTEEFYPHFTSGVKLIPLQDAVESQQAARNSSTLNLSTGRSTSTTPMPTIKSNTLPVAAMRAPSSAASSSYSRDFSDCDDDDDEVNTVTRKKEALFDHFDDNEVLPVQRRERRHNGKSPERAPSSASRKSTKSTGSQLAASVKSKLKWPFSNSRHKKSEDEAEEFMQQQQPPVKAVQKPSNIGTSSFPADYPLIDASPSISAHSVGGSVHVRSLHTSSQNKSANDFTRHRAGVGHGHERMMSADSLPCAAAAAPPFSEANEFYADDNADIDDDDGKNQQERHRRNAASIASFFAAGQRRKPSATKFPSTTDGKENDGSSADLYYNKHNLSDSETAPAAVRRQPDITANRSAEETPPPVYANLASLAAARQPQQQKEQPLQNSSTKHRSANDNNKKRLSTFSSLIVNVHASLPQQHPSQLSASSTLTTRTLPSAGAGGQQPLYANNSTIIDALKQRHLLQQQQQQQQQQHQQQQQLIDDEVMRLQPCSREFSNSGALLTFELAAVAAAAAVERKSASVGSSNTVDDDEELDRVVAGGCDNLTAAATGSASPSASTSSWATQSLPARARARKKA